MLLDDIYIMWIPILVVALMGALGAWRGVYREIAVSAAIVLSALIVVQWATRERWASDLSSTFTGLGAGEWQFFLTLVLLFLIVSVVGYGLGGLFARRTFSSTPRVLGALLGLANGAALTGWVLRAAYEGLVSKQETSAVYQNPISLGLMVWAGWFPVVLAVLGAVAALVFSLRGDRVASVPDTSQQSAAIVTATPARPVYIPQAPPPYSPLHPLHPRRARMPTRPSPPVRNQLCSCLPASRRLTRPPPPIPWPPRRHPPTWPHTARRVQFSTFHFSPRLQQPRVKVALQVPRSNRHQPTISTPRSATRRQILPIRLHLAMTLPPSGASKAAQHLPMPLLLQLPPSLLRSKHQLKGVVALAEL